MERIFYHYSLWEDYHNGMYDECKQGRQERVKKAVEILGTPEICKKAMERVVNEWTIATQYNLSNAEINRKAWLGQACCSLYANVHEDEVREAWGLLTNEQRKQANLIAYQIIKKWIYKYEKKHSNQISLFD